MRITADAAENAEDADGKKGGIHGTWMRPRFLKNALKVRIEPQISADERR